MISQRRLTKSTLGSNLYAFMYHFLREVLFLVEASLYRPLYGVTLPPPPPPPHPPEICTKWFK